MTPTVLAFDPGGRKSGVVLRRGEELLGWSLERRSGGGPLIGDGHYLRGQVIGAGLRLLREAGLDPADTDAYVVGVEQVAWWPTDTRKRGPDGKPRPERDQRGLYSTAYVIGAILLRWPDAVVVDSGRGAGKFHPQSYPEPIRGPGDGRADRLIDVRAAWDHSHAAETLHLRRVREATP